LTTDIKMPSTRRQAKQTHQPRQTSPDATPPVSPFAWLPYYLPQEEMEAVWREWGWRVLGRQPVAEEDRAAFEMVCRQLHTNWGAVYRPVAMLPPLQTPEHARDDTRLVNHCLAAGWALSQQGQPITCENLAEHTGGCAADIERLLPRIRSVLDTAKGTIPCNT